MKRRSAAFLVALVAAVWALWPAGRVEATVEMQVAAKKLGFEFSNCLYCHASPHAAQVMKDKAKALAMSDGNCVACHGSEIPATLNARGDWLVFEKRKRKAKVAEMAWLKDYKEPTPAPASADRGAKAKP